MYLRSPDVHRRAFRFSVRIDRFSPDAKLANLLKLLVVLVCLGAIVQRLIRVDLLKPELRAFAAISIRC
jgi:hypothetical protein